MIHVVLELTEERHASIPMAVPLVELRMVAWNSHVNAVTEVRRWLGERAKLRWIVTNPERKHEIIPANETIWMHARGGGGLRCDGNPLESWELDELQRKLRTALEHASR